jgi:hypothetical protein
MDKRSRMYITALLVMKVFALGAWAGGGGGLTCLTKTWVNSTCSGSCGSSYTICPGAVKCVKTATGKDKKIDLGMQQIACRDYVGGTGQCTSNGFQCSGGTYLGASSTLVIVATEDCTGTCP